MAQIIQWSKKQQNVNPSVYTCTHIHTHMRTVTEKKKDQILIYTVTVF